MAFSKTSCAPFFLLLAACVGCWSSPPRGRVTAYGEVRVKGIPIPEGQIDFQSVEDGIGGGATRIGAGGRFRLFLWPSTYRVGIVSVEGGMSPAGFTGVEASRIRVPERYAVPARSGIEVKIDSANRCVVLELDP